MKWLKREPPHTQKKRLTPSCAEILSINGFNIQLFRKPVKNINLRIHREKGIIVSAPQHASTDVITAFIQQKASWIQKNLEDQQKALLYLQPKLINGAQCYLWGEALTLRIESNKKLHCIKSEKELILFVPHNAATYEKIEKCIDDFYRQELTRATLPLIQIWQAKVSVSVKSWRIRKMRSRWGSCHTSKADICLNLQLTKYPKSCLEYVLVHELTHLHEHYHNKRFYTLMSKYLPDWQSRESILENYFK